MAYREKIVDRVPRDGHVLCPLCDSRFADDAAFDLHRGEPTFELEFVCISATEREKRGLVREREVWSVA